MSKPPAISTAATLADASPGPAPTPAPPRLRPVHYVLSSHWDREWHQPFQVFRFELIRLLDEVLDAIAADTLQGPFYCDGQSIVLEDYLEIRPDRRDELAAALRSGAIVAGPWYVLADELSVSGESLIRNLRYGRELVRRLGAEPSDAGFLGDLFGHHGQMPQLLKSFGIGGAYLWRGVNRHDLRQFNWRGSDGTVIPTHRFGTNGYWGFAVNVSNFTDHQHAASEPEQFNQRLADHLRDEAAVTQIGHVLLFDGPDHNQLDPAIYQLVRDRLGPGDDDLPFDLQHVSLDEHQRQMIRDADRITETIDGELLEAARHPLQIDQQWLILGTLAARVWIKQENSRVQAMLCQWAEPWGAVTGGLRAKPEAPGLLELAWRLLMMNHAHDSICGCSIDEVHRDMAGRFRQAGQIAETSARDALHHVAAAVEQSIAEDHERLCLFNPLPRASVGVREVTVQIPAEWPVGERFNTGAEPYVHFQLLDEDGQPVHYQLLSQQRDRLRVLRLPKRSPLRLRAHEVRLAVDADLPALGYRTLRLTPADPTLPPPARYLGRGLAENDRTLANAHLRLTAESDGSVTLIDLDTDQTYRHLLTYEDTGDLGDGWVHEYPINRQLITSPGSPVQVSLIEDGPLQATLLLCTRMSVPEAFDTSTQRRAETCTELRIDTRVTLCRGQRFVQVQTTVHNNVRDHRLRVLMPTGADVDHYLVDSPFDAVQRRVGLPEDANAYREPPVETTPQQSWTAAFDGKRGLAVVAAGLMETCVRDTPDRPIALTLLRAHSRTAFTNGQPDGQLQSELIYHHTLQPLAEAPDPVALTEAGQALNAGPQSVQLPGIHAAFWHRPEADMPATTSAATLDGPVVLSSLRRVDDVLEARLYNPSTQPAGFSLRLQPFATTPPTRARWVNSESRPLGDWVDLDDGTLRETLQPKQFATFRLS